MICNKATKGIIFDLDGVLVDTGRYHHQAWKETADCEGFEMTEEFFFSTFGMQNHQVIPMLIEDVGADDIARISEEKEQRFRNLVTDGIQLLDGAEQLLAALRIHGYKTSVGSSTIRKNLELIMTHTRAEAMFDALVWGEDVRNGKPAPDTFLRAAEKMDVEPGCCVVIEDASAGVEAGKTAGMAVIGVTGTRTREELSLVGADLVVDSLTELTISDFEKLLS